MKKEHFEIVLEDMNNKLSNISEGYQGLNDKIDNLDKKLDANTKELRDEMIVRFDYLDRKVDDLTVRTDKIETKLDQIDKQVDKIETKLDQIDKRVDKIEIKLDQVDKRTDRIEDKLDKVTENHEQRIITLETKVA